MTQTLTHRPDPSKRHSERHGAVAAAMAGRTQADPFHEHGMVVNHVGHDDHDDGLVHGHAWAAAE